MLTAGHRLWTPNLSWALTIRIEIGKIHDSSKLSIWSHWFKCWQDPPDVTSLLLPTAIFYSQVINHTLWNWSLGIGLISETPSSNLAVPCLMSLGFVSLDMLPTAFFHPRVTNHTQMPLFGAGSFNFGLIWSFIFIRHLDTIGAQYLHLVSI